MDTEEETVENSTGGEQIQGAAQNEDENAQAMQKIQILMMSMIGRKNGGEATRRRSPTETANATAESVSTITEKTKQRKERRRMRIKKKQKGKA